MIHNCLFGNRDETESRAEQSKADTREPRSKLRIRDFTRREYCNVVPTFSSSVNGKALPLPPSRRFHLLIRRRLRRPFSSMATTESIGAVSSDGLRNRLNPTVRLDDSPRSDSTVLAGATSDQDPHDSKDNLSSHQHTKVLGRTPDGTGKCPCILPHVRIYGASQSLGPLGCAAA